MATSNYNNDLFFLDLVIDDRKKSELNIDKYIIAVPPNKIMKKIEDFCNKCIESKYTRIVKHKAMIQ